MADEATVRIQPLGGVWETIGSDRLRGIVPESIEASCNDWGPDTLNFVLKAEAGARRPDVLPYTPVELEIGGVLVWAGFVWQRPSDANGYAVGCRGWQYHLDDDLFDRVYVHTRLSDYRDARSFLGCNLANFHAGGFVTSDNGALVIGWPKGFSAVTGDWVGVILDLGPDSTAKRAVVQWESSNNEASTLLFCRGNGSEDSSVLGDDAFTFALNTGASGTSAGTFATARRYVHLFLFYNGGGSTFGADVRVRIDAVQIFRATAYESGNTSVMPADVVVKDALTFAPLLNQATTLITAGTFNIPEYLTGGYLTPRQVMEAVNAYENYRLKIGGADLMTLIYDVKPSTPLLEVGDWSGAEFSDATVSGDPIYNRAITDATGPDSARLVSKRTQTGTLVDRRSFTRSAVLPVNTAVTQAVADRFGDLWLTEHKTAPFSGLLVVTGNSARRVTGGASVPAHELLLYAGEKIRLSNRVDPDTGAWGRDGRIAGVTYRHDDRQAQVAIDDQRTRFERILARYGVLTTAGAFVGRLRRPTGFSR